MKGGTGNGGTDKNSDAGRDRRSTHRKAEKIGADEEGSVPVTEGGASGGHQA